MNPFDPYTLKARIAPALLLLLPLAAATYAWIPFPQDVSMLGILSALSLAALIALAWETGHAGQVIQTGLFARWGGAPTIQLLRHLNSELNAVEKARYLEIVQRHRPDLVAPTMEAERADPTAADAIYEQVVLWLREQTRDARRFPLVAAENASFGFHRNLYALRGAGYISSIAGVLGNLTLLVLPAGPNVVFRAMFGLVASGVSALLIAQIASESRVREAGFMYARVLIRAIDGLASKP